MTRHFLRSLKPAVGHVWTIAIWNEHTGEASIEVVNTAQAAHEREKAHRAAGKVVDVKARLLRGKE